MMTLTDSEPGRAPQQPESQTGSVSISELRFNAISKARFRNQSATTVTHLGRDKWKPRLGWDQRSRMPPSDGRVRSAIGRIGHGKLQPLNKASPRIFIDGIRNNRMCASFCQAQK